MEIMKLKIKGMHCKACEMLIRDILEEEEIEVISVSQNTGILEFNYDDKIQRSAGKLAFVLEGFELADSEDSLLLEIPEPFSPLLNLLNKLIL